MQVVLISTYEMGRQPFGLASPAAWLLARGHQVHCVDLSISAFPDAAIRDAGLIAFYLPMHTATRLASAVIAKVRLANSTAHLAAYGLYAPLNPEYLRALGIATIAGGEFEGVLADLADSLSAGSSARRETIVSVDRLRFLKPHRAELPSLSRYARLCSGTEQLIAGYTEASRGCKHLCRHCPIVPVYQGVFRVVQHDVVLDDVRQQVEAGARHITFGDPDFFNGPAHAVRIVEALHREFPDVSYDVTIKVEHLLRHRSAASVLKATGCLFVTSAMESVDDLVLRKLEKGHTRQDIVEAVGLCRSLGLLLNPTFIAFLPWTTRESYADLLATIRLLDLVDQVSPIQLALRLLVPAGSRLLELDEMSAWMNGFEPGALAWTWSHPDPAIDDLAKCAMAIVGRGQKSGASRRHIFRQLWSLVTGEALPDQSALLPRASVPYLNEPWYC